MVPAGRHWADIGGRRHFSATFYADLLSDMGVRLAILLNERGGGGGGDWDGLDPDRAVFCAAGVRVLTVAVLSAGQAGPASTEGGAPPCWLLQYSA